MGEIKFRAWNKVEGKMYTDAINNCKDSFEMVLKHPQIYEVMQYIGLKDKNGTEIYEGDIVVQTPVLVSNQTPIKGVVKYIECAYWIDNGERAVILFTEFNENEIVGNTYENPELLEDMH